MKGLPVVLRLTGRTALVVGGGPVGRRKAASLADAGAVVRVVTLNERPDGWRAEIAWDVRPVVAADFRGVDVVIAAATARVNRRVTRAAKRRRLWVCRVDRPDDGEIDFLAAGHLGRVIIGVGTGGAAPALAARLRDRFVSELGDGIHQWADLLAEFRPVVHEFSCRQSRHEIYRQFCEWIWLGRIKENGIDEVRSAWKRMIASQHACW